MSPRRKAARREAMSEVLVIVAGLGLAGVNCYSWLVGVLR